LELNGTNVCDSDLAHCVPMLLVRILLTPCTSEVSSTFLFSVFTYIILALYWCPTCRLCSLVISRFSHNFCY